MTIFSRVKELFSSQLHAPNESTMTDIENLYSEDSQKVFIRAYSCNYVMGSGLIQLLNSNSVSQSIQETLWGTSFSKSDYGNGVLALVPDWIRTEGIRRNNIATYTFGQNNFSFPVTPEFHRQLVQLRPQYATAGMNPRNSHPVDLRAVKSCASLFKEMSCLIAQPYNPYDLEGMNLNIRKISTMLGISEAHMNKIEQYPVLNQISQ